MALKAMQRFSYRTFGGFARRRLNSGKLAEPLAKARIPVHADAFVATVFVNTMLTFIFSFGLVAGAQILLVPRLAAAIPAIAKFAPAFWLLPFVISGLTYMVASALPSSKARKRAKNINLRLPYALNYIAAMASAGVVPTAIFGSLAKQRIYGDVAGEAAGIYKDLALHGKDIVTALRRAIERTPSVKFQEFLQGSITTITSGGDLKAYFFEKAARYQFENRQEQKVFIETMGLMAETYVTVAVAGPLFLIVMLAIIGIISGGGIRNLQMLTYLMLPVVNGGYVFLLNSMIPEV